MDTGHGATTMNKFLKSFFDVPLGSPTAMYLREFERQRESALLAATELSDTTRNSGTSAERDAVAVFVRALSDAPPPRWECADIEAGEIAKADYRACVTPALKRLLDSLGIAAVNDPEDSRLFGDVPAAAWRLRLRLT